MSVHQFFKRTAVQPQQAQQLRTVTLPAPTRGLIMNENASFVQPGAAQVLDNWKPTMTGCALRGGFVQWTQLPETTPVVLPALLQVRDSSTVGSVLALM